MRTDVLEDTGQNPGINFLVVGLWGVLKGPRRQTIALGMGWPFGANNKGDLSYFKVHY